MKKEILLLCSKDDLKQYVLGVYLDKAEEINVGIVDSQIANVSQEIIEQLAHLYIISNPVPATLRNIASVLSAYRTLSAITSLITTEANSDNEWLPLQGQYQKSIELLQLIAQGKQSLPITKVAGS